MRARRHPKLVTPADVQMPIDEEQAARSLLHLEALPITRKCAVERNALRGRGRGLLFGQMASKNIADCGFIVL
jgi:hypothetical protein